MTDIERNAQRWPYRRYSVSNNQISATCGTPGAPGKYVVPTSADYAVCDVDAKIDWHVANDQSKVGGLTKVFYELTVSTTNGMSEIFAQTENVISRHPE